MTPEEIDVIFHPIADAVERFAEAEGLRIEKCARGNSGWELVRPHDLKGSLYLLLLHDATLGLGVGAVWQFACPEMSVLYSHFRPIHPCPIEPEKVIKALTSELRELSRVEFGYWTHIAPFRNEP